MHLITAYISHYYICYHRRICAYYYCHIFFIIIIAYASIFMQRMWVLPGGIFFSLLGLLLSPLVRLRLGFNVPHIEL